MASHTDLQDFFSTLDIPFINFTKDIEPIVWQGSDILIHKVFDVRIPAMAGSTIKYSFSSKIGDLYFCTQFLLPGSSDEVVIEPNRVPSDIEKITGKVSVNQNYYSQGIYCPFYLF